MGVRNNTVDSAPPTVLPFPQTRVTRRRVRSSMEAAGFLSLLLLDREGEAIPTNVQRIDEPDGMELPDRSPTLMLAVLIFEALPAKKRERIRRIVRGMAYAQDPLPDAVRLHNVLRTGALNGKRCDG